MNILLLFYFIDYFFKIIETAFNALKQSSTDPFYRKQAWEVINCYLTASRNLNDDENTLINLFLHPSFQDANTIPNIKGSIYKSIYNQARETYQTALTGTIKISEEEKILKSCIIFTGMFVGAAIKELAVVPTVVSLVRHYNMVSVAQQSAGFAYIPN